MICIYELTRKFGYIKIYKHYSFEIYFEIVLQHRKVFPKENFMKKINDFLTESHRKKIQIHYAF